VPTHLLENSSIIYIFVVLDRSNLGNARLQGLPEDALGGDPTGTKFDWVNSAFFFSYVWLKLYLSRTPSQHSPLDHLPSTHVLDEQAGFTANMASLMCYWLGHLLYTHGKQTK
jgi:hypothetical protein